MIKACIFDLDGTLADTLLSMAVIANQVLGELGLPTLPAENFRYYCGEGAGVLVKKCLLDAGDRELLHFEQAEKRYRELFNNDPLYQVKKYAGMEETLRALKAKGIFLGVCTNKPHPAAMKVVHSLYGDIFDMIQGQQGNLPRKPAPDIPLLIAEKSGAAPEECLYAGDSGTDMLTGNAAGMLTVGVLWGFRDRSELLENGARYLIERPEELLWLAGSGTDISSPCDDAPGQGSAR